ncbi:hypothetical protein [Kitasatospora griseola]|uniref:hypothetical protein n=1 Tax=Kitasatospora griseola TaxID=2064 RepID=UPI0019AA2D3B|nr:hypothetical protein GCM10010195_66940 [Kitasatospora griseola]
MGGPLDGQLVDVTGWAPDELECGAALIAPLGHYGAGGRAHYEPRPGDIEAYIEALASLSQAVEDVDDELGREAWLRTRLMSRRSAPCAYQVTDAQRWLGPPVSRCLR